MGCDDFTSSSSSSDTKTNLELTCVISTSTQIPLQSGDIGFYDCGKYRIIVTTNTKLLQTRESCSGFNSAKFSELLLGDTLFVKYDSENIDYSKKPTEVRAQNIEAYGIECISGSFATDPDDGCDVCDFIN